MATQSINFPYIAGESGLLIRLRSLSDRSIVATQSSSELSNKNGIQTAIFVDIPASNYLTQLVDVSEDILAQDTIKLTLTDNIFWVDSVTMPSSGLPISSLGVDAISDSSISSSAVTKIQNGLATSVQVSGIPNQVISNQMPESYATSGVNMTLAQALYMIHQSINHFAISGAIISVKKLDGSEAATFTLNSPSKPTSRTRS